MQFHLQVKIQKHAAFEADVNSHVYMIEGIEASGKEMIDEAHYATDFVMVSLTDISNKP